MQQTGEFGFMGFMILSQIITMLIIMVIGVLSYKKRIITQNGVRELSDLLLMIVNPIVIFISYQREYEAELLKNLFLTMALSFVTYFIMIICSGIFFSNKRKNYAIERFASIYSNCGFFGIPLVSAVIGLDGVFYLTAYMTVFNLLVWTHGISLMNENKIQVKELWKSMINPNIISVLLGFILFLCNISLPEQLYSGMKFVGDMNTPLAMMIAGITLAQADILKILKDKNIYYVSLIRLIVFPIFILILLSVIPVLPIIKNVLLIACACPVGATLTLFTIRANKNTEYASSLYVVTTVMAAVTIPIVILLSEYIWKSS